MSYHIRRKKSPGGDAYCLVDDAGDILPHQLTTTLTSSVNERPEFTVTFYAGKNGLRVVDEDEG